ncbi:60S ribosomal export protein NMD3 [Methanothermobacter wolfeii]|uniref:60S ribosomal export protein NMD3 n=1 Tax=Methanothermobacter wolfeii TaxID=145261 RepID=A0A9E7RV83_METWO|nr:MULTISPECIES: 60S ribosomal export protein NMD3 [Methanothermobacter]MDI6702666.1 60S ribosomal export protein NMD3 [Methanothermobacter wolfeii]NLM03045.1 hypothetical protein [Methanothermobacter wolfeii]QHN05865.1 hypothetical protein FZP57_01435 [Methanothermobacter sp. THM-1]UXH32022.1 NMD3-related protein [Methanothermobacter wolfeii]SCM56068.1 putative protein MJ1650 [Methanothermobacter wolfeii]
MFCVRCGRSDSELFKGLCRDCFLEEYSILSIPERIDVNICSHCHSKLVSGRWLDEGLPEEEIIYRALEDNISWEPPVEDPEIELEITQRRGSIYRCHVEVDAEVLGRKMHQEYWTEVRLINTVCPSCSKQSSGYYEAVIQLRADSRRLSKSEVETADRIVKRTLSRLSKRDRLAYLPRRVEVKEGVDYYIGSHRSARKVTGALKEEMGGISMESPRLMGQDKSTGRGLYRTWISLRLAEFRKGDFISHRGQKGAVLGFKASGVNVRDLETGEIRTILWGEYDNIEVIARAGDVKRTTVTSRSPTMIQVLHPETFEPVDLEVDSRTSKLEIGEEVPVIEIKRRLYIIEDDLQE